MPIHRRSAKMAEKESHTKGNMEGLFCAVRTDPKKKCECGNNYVDNCKPSEDWGKYPQRYTFPGKELGAIRRSHEAHHIACVASVTKLFAPKKDADPDIQKVVHNTKWCINHKQNMIALPKWAHTIEWYCLLLSPTRAEILSQLESDGSVSTPMEAPKFANLAQHDYDHTAYIEEVDEKLERILSQVKELKGKHKEQEKTLKKELNSLVNKQKLELQRRGRDRKGGTHAAWQLGMNDRKSDWYLPFSMAKDSEADPRTFPVWNMSDGGTMAKKILEVAEAIWLEIKRIPI
jgi:hypothetical protein